MSIDRALQGVAEAHAVLAAYHERVMDIVSVADSEWLNYRPRYRRIAQTRDGDELFGGTRLYPSEPSLWAPAWPTAFWGPEGKHSTSSVLSGKTPKFAMAVFAARGESAPLPVPELWLGVVRFGRFTGKSQSLSSVMARVWDAIRVPDHPADYSHWTSLSARPVFVAPAVEVKLNVQVTNVSLSSVRSEKDVADQLVARIADRLELTRGKG